MLCLVRGPAALTWRRAHNELTSGNDDHHMAVWSRVRTHASCLFRLPLCGEHGADKEQAQQAAKGCLNSDHWLHAISDLAAVLNPSSMSGITRRFNRGGL